MGQITASERGRGWLVSRYSNSGPRVIHWCCSGPTTKWWTGLLHVCVQLEQVVGINSESEQLILFGSPSLSLDLVVQGGSYLNSEFSYPQFTSHRSECSAAADVPLLFFSRVFPPLQKFGEESRLSNWWGSIVLPVSITALACPGPWSRPSSDVGSSHNGPNQRQIPNLRMEKSDLRRWWTVTKDLRAHKRGKSFAASVNIN